MIQSGNGGMLTITKDGAVPIDAYKVPEWAESTDYEVDDIVRTEDTTDGTKQMKYWRSRKNRESESGDKTGEDANTAGVLNNAYWDPIAVGQPYTVLNWALNAPTTQSERELLAEINPRVEYTTGAMTLQVQFADNWEGDKTQQALENRNSEVYVEFFPKGNEKAGRQVYKGNARVGPFNKAGRPGEDITFDVTLAFDGDPTIDTVTA